MSGNIGLGEGARRQLNLLRELAPNVGSIDLTAALIPNRDRVNFECEIKRPGEADVTIIYHVNPPEMPRALAASAPNSSAYRIGFWMYETEAAPNYWRPATRLVNEIWAPSNFAAAALEKTLNRPVSVVPYPVSNVAGTPGMRPRLGLEASHFVVLFSYDVRSSHARKNPEGAIAAFRNAFPSHPDARLLIKVSNIDAWAPARPQLVAAADGDPRVIFLTETLSAADMAGVVEAADVVLSLHRSEGYGLLLADAMARGVPVIATRWSGNMDFMSESNSLLVDARLCPIIDAQGMYKEGRWADPDLSEAIRHLVACYSSLTFRKTLGDQAKSSQHQQFANHIKATYEKRLRNLGVVRAH